MKDRLKQGIKNNKGSSLAFVLIISMVLMVMVGSLLAVANSGLSFTQESVESRQAYVDAKSVIEFGKVEINSRMTDLNNKNLTLQGYYHQYSDEKALSNPDVIKLNKLENDISVTEFAREKLAEELDDAFVIYGNAANVVETLTPDAPTPLNAEKIAQLGELKVKKDPIVENKYIFTVETQGLKRNLDYEVTFSYAPTTIIENFVPGDTHVTPPLPTYIKKDAFQFWRNGKINNQTTKVDKNYVVSSHFSELGSDKVEDSSGKLTVDYPLENIDISGGFSWTNGKILNLRAKNVWVTNPIPTTGVSIPAQFNITAIRTFPTPENKNIPGQLCFEGIYQQENKGTNTLIADNVIFKKNLVVGDKSTLKIDCGNLFVEGDIILNSASSLLDIKADNIFVTGNITLASGTKISSVCANVWVNGNITINSAATTIDFKNLNYFKCGDVNLHSDTQLNITGLTSNNQIIMGNIAIDSASSKLVFTNINYLKTGDISLSQESQFIFIGALGKTNNQMIIGTIQPKSSANKFTVKITNLASFTCTNFSLNQNSSLELQSESILINGAFTLDRLTSMNITTQYFDCTGPTKINYLEKNPLNFNSISGVPLNIRFAGGYDQINSTVNIKNADLVIFGGPFSLSPNSFYLNVEANNIYLNSDAIKIQQGGQFNYTGINGSFTNINMNSDIRSWVWDTLIQEPLLANGNYKASVITQTIPNGLSYQGVYQAPAWPNSPVIPSSDKTTIDVKDGIGLNGTEKYY